MVKNSFSGAWQMCALRSQFFNAALFDRIYRGFCVIWPMRLRINSYGWVIGLLMVGCAGGSSGTPSFDASAMQGSDAAASATPDSSASDSGTPMSLTPLPADVGRIVVSPAALLFTKPGEVAVLHAEVFDASGQKTAIPVTWESTRPAMVGVDASGQVTAMVAVGSSQIRVRAGALISAPVMVVVAEPVAGAVLVSDSQIIAGPFAADKAAPNQVGSNVTLTVAGVAALSPGTALLASQGKAVAGRVVSATPVAGKEQLDVVLQTVPLLNLFARLNVDGSYDIDPAAMAQALATPAMTSPLRVEPQKFVGPVQQGLTLRELMLGPFKCEAKILGGALTGSANVDLRPNMTFNHRFVKDETTGDWTELMVKLEGTMTVIGTVDVNFSPLFVGTAGCEAVIVKIPAPLAGALSAVVRFEIPLSIAGELSGVISLLSLKGGVELKGESKIAMGFRYTPQGGTTDLGDYSNKTELKPTFTLPTGDSPGTTLTASLAFGGAAGLNISSLLGSLSLLKASLLLKAELKAGRIRNGLIFAGAYDLKPTVEAGVGADVEKAMQWFGGLAAVKSAVTLTLPVIAESPRGKFTADKKTVQPNQPVTLTVDLDPKSLKFLSLDNVVDVRIYRPSRTGVDFELVDTIGASAGKTNFTHTFTPTFLDAAAGMVSFWAGVSTKLLPGVALEVNEMSKLDINIGDGASLWKGTVTATCTRASSEMNGDTFSQKISTTVQLEHLTEQDALMANAKVTGTGMASYKRTHDYKAGTPACPISVHEETIGMATSFEPILYQTKFTDSTGDYALIGGAYIKGTQQLIHTETPSCKPSSTRIDPVSSYSESSGYNISGKVAPDAKSFSGSKNFPDTDGSCDWTWTFNRIQ